MAEQKRDWKPGELATQDGHPAAPFFKTKEGWFYSDGDRSGMDLGSLGPSIRPLVVIDPEDREQVHLLTEAFAVNEGRYSDPVGDMQAALREFANPTPPRPEEPTGLGAVVEDAFGRKWMRDYERGMMPWVKLEETDINGLHPTGTRRAYADLEVVKVLPSGMVPS